MDRAILCQLLFIFSNQQRDRTFQLDSLFSIIHPFSLLKQRLRGAERTEKPWLAKMSRQWNLKKSLSKKKPTSIQNKQRNNELFSYFNQS